MLTTFTDAWSSTSSLGGNFGDVIGSERIEHFKLQDDGNMVVYKSGGGAEWASSTSGSNLVLRLQDDGNLVLTEQGGGVKWDPCSWTITGNHCPTVGKC